MASERVASEDDLLEGLLTRAAEIDGGDHDFAVKPAPSGIASFDKSTGIGGVPRNRIAIFQGEEHSGKTLLLLRIIAEAQKNGGRCAFIDAEHALSPQFTRLLGVDWEALEPFVRRPKTLDQAYDLLKEFARSGLFDVIGFDSVTALSTADAIEAPAGSKASRAAVARMHSEELPKIVAIQHSRTAIIFINQMRENPNPPTWYKGGKLLYTPGGKALRHYSSMTVEIKSGEVYKKGDVRIGHQLKTKIVKNKVGTPFLQSEFDLMYAEGLDLTSNTVDLCIDIGIIKQSGSWFYLQMIDPESGEEMGEPRRFAGRQNLEQALKEDTDMMEYVNSLVARHQASNEPEED